MPHLAVLDRCQLRDCLDVDKHSLQGPVMVHASACVTSNHPEAVTAELVQQAEQLWQGVGDQVLLAPRWCQAGSCTRLVLQQHELSSHITTAWQTKFCMSRATAGTDLSWIQHELSTHITKAWQTHSACLGLMQAGQTYLLCPALKKMSDQCTRQW